VEAYQLFILSHRSFNIPADRFAMSASSSCKAFSWEAPKKHDAPPTLRPLAFMPETINTATESRRRRMQPKVYTKLQKLV